MKQVIALLILLPFLLVYWAFWGCVLIISMFWQLFRVTVIWLIRSADGQEETFCGIWNLEWDESSPAAIWIVFKNPLAGI